MTAKHATLGAWTALTIIGVFTTAASAQYGVFTDDFNSYGNDVLLNDQADWYVDPSTSNPAKTFTGVGVNGSVGVGPAQYSFIWDAHPFDYNDADFTGAVFRMDYQTDAAGHLDDDRLGWTITGDNSNSDNIIGVQLDPGGSGASGYNIETYWDNASGASVRNSIADLPTLSANSWYQLELTVTKLTATSARMDVEFWALNAAGDRVGTNPLVSGIVADTSALGTDSAPERYFNAAEIFPVYKNYSTIDGAADNAYAHVVPEPATLALLGLGGVALIRKRRR